MVDAHKLCQVGTCAYGDTEMVLTSRLEELA
jgi:hypothetical protein